MCVNTSRPIWETLSAGGFHFWWCAVYSVWWIGVILTLVGLAEIWLIRRLGRPSNNTSIHKLPRRGVRMLLVSVSCAIVVIVIGLRTYFKPDWILWSMGLKPSFSLFDLTPEGWQFLLDRLERIALATVMGWGAIVFIGGRLISLKYITPNETDVQRDPPDEPSLVPTEVLVLPNHHSGKTITPRIMITLLSATGGASVNVHKDDGVADALQQDISEFYCCREFHISESGGHFWIDRKPQPDEIKAGESLVSGEFNDELGVFVVHGLGKNPVTSGVPVYVVTSREHRVTLSANSQKILLFKQNGGEAKIEIRFPVESGAVDA